MTPCPVSIASDWTHAYGCGHTMPSPDADLPGPMNWSSGEGFGTHSKAGKVLHKGEVIILEAHDLGPFMPHLLCSLAVPKSSRKMAFAASTVVIEKKPGACTKPLTPMLACADIALPLGNNVSNLGHSVILGMTDFDVQLGWYDIGSAMVIDTFSLVLSLGTCEPGEVGVADFVKDVLGIDPTKTSLGALFSLHRSVLVSWHNDWTTPIGTKFGMGGSIAGASLEFSYDPAKQRVVAKATITGPGFSVEDAASGGADGVKHSTTAKTPLDGGHEKTWGDAL